MAGIVLLLKTFKTIASVITVLRRIKPFSKADQVISELGLDKKFPKSKALSIARSLIRVGKILGLGEGGSAGGAPGLALLLRSFKNLNNTLNALEQVKGVRKVEEIIRILKLKEDFPQSKALKIATAALSLLKKLGFNDTFNKIKAPKKGGRKTAKRSTGASMNGTKGAVGGRRKVVRTRTRTVTRGASIKSF